LVGQGCCGEGLLAEHRRGSLAVAVQQRVRQTPSTATAVAPGQWRSDRPQPLHQAPPLGWRRQSPHGLDKPCEIVGLELLPHNAGQRSGAARPFGGNARSRASLERGQSPARSFRCSAIPAAGGQCRSGSTRPRPEHHWPAWEASHPPPAQPDLMAHPAWRPVVAAGSGVISMCHRRQHLPRRSQNSPRPLVSPLEIDCRPSRLPSPWPCAPASSIWRLEEVVALLPRSRSMRGRCGGSGDFRRISRSASARPNDPQCPPLPSARRMQAGARCGDPRSPGPPPQRTPPGDPSGAPR